METNLLDRMLNSYLDGRTPVTVTLQNKIRITGKIKAFDGYVIVMDDHKQEILYRHAISSVVPHLQEEQKRQPAAAATKPAAAKPAPARIAPRPAKAPLHKPRPSQPQPLAASVKESLNNSMKDGLLKWMQEQRATK